MEVLGNTEKRLGVLNIIVFILSFYVMGVLIFDTFYEFPKETAILLSYIDTAICIFFFLEFSVRFFQAENKLSFMKWGWIDLISCIPMVDFLRMGRILSIIRLIRVVRAFRTTTHLVNHLFANKAQGTFTSISVIAILLVIFSAIGILQVENDPNSNIKTAEDAIWWAYVTITTVGYGDKFPVTSEGRIIASVLMTAGVGLFGTFTAFVASWFVDVKSEKET